VKTPYFSPRNTVGIVQRGNSRFFPRINQTGNCSRVEGYFNECGAKNCRHSTLTPDGMLTHFFPGTKSVVAHHGPPRGCPMGNSFLRGTMPTPAPPGWPLMTDGLVYQAQQREKNCELRSY